MQIDRLETHDRLGKFKEDNSLDISMTCQDIINQRPFGNVPFYIFAHKREIGVDERISMFNQDLTASLQDLSYKRQWDSMEKVPSARLIWQPRLTKPKAQTNSMLFRAHPPSDCVKVVWIIPPRELWEQYGKGKISENSVVSESIYNFQNNINILEAPENDDLTDEQIDAVYKQLKIEAEMKKGKPKQFIPIFAQ